MNVDELNQWEHITEIKEKFQDGKSLSRGDIAELLDAVKNFKIAYNLSEHRARKYERQINFRIAQNEAEQESEVYHDSH